MLKYQQWRSMTKILRSKNSYLMIPYYFPHDFFCTHHAISNRNPTSEIAAKKCAVKILFKHIHRFQNFVVAQIVLRYCLPPSDDPDKCRLTVGADDGFQLR